MSLFLRSTPHRFVRSCVINHDFSSSNVVFKYAMSGRRLSYECEIECESLQRYRPGGYHPVNIGDTFSFGRYQIIQKLGWGGYSTVWLAYDRILSRLAALKVVVAELHEPLNEVRILRHLFSIPAKHEGRRCLRDLKAHVLHSGPNGTHQCLIFDVHGVSVPSLVSHYGNGTRLPGRIAWEISRQVTLALDCLHSNGVAHGDLYTGNILVASTEEQTLDLRFLRDLPPPVQAEIDVIPGHHNTKSLPRRIVEPVTLPIPPIKGPVYAKLIDFEQSFLQIDETPNKVRTPLIFRAPETLLDSTYDLRMDIWSLACVIFDLVVGQPPFDNFMPQKAPLVLEWIAMFGDVPMEWKQQADTVVGTCKDEIDGGSLPNWLRESYVNGYGKMEFSEDDIECLGDLLTRMMRYRPEDRLVVHDILQHEWFAKGPFGC